MEPGNRIEDALSGIEPGTLKRRNKGCQGGGFCSMQLGAVTYDVSQKQTTNLLHHTEICRPPQEFRPFQMKSKRFPYQCISIFI